MVSEIASGTLQCGLTRSSVAVGLNISAVLGRGGLRVHDLRHNIRRP